MFLQFTQSTRYEDCECLLHRAQLINDIISFNSTTNLGESYQNWIYRHQELMDELKYMLIKDIDLIKEKEDGFDESEALAH